MTDPKVSPRFLLPINCPGCGYKDQWGVPKYESGYRPGYREMEGYSWSYLRWECKVCKYVVTTKTYSELNDDRSNSTQT